MVTFENHTDVIKAYAELNRPLTKELIDDLEAVSTHLEMLGEDDRWIIYVGQCRVCNHKATIVTPAVNDIENEPCYNCGHDTMQPIEVPEWEDDG